MGDEGEVFADQHAGVTPGRQPGGRRRVSPGKGPGDGDDPQAQAEQGAERRQPCVRHRQGEEIAGEIDVGGEFDHQPEQQGDRYHSRQRIAGFGFPVKLAARIEALRATSP